MPRVKRSLFAALGWLTWKVLALVGLPYAKKKIAGNTTATHHDNNATHGKVEP